ncbi:MEAB protein [Ophiocordyceps camponoti-floridani]|uniref:MEAB protein n=1 Tax=Ophiocordyceps camponoti-floridani TaxID=2030778 RepID=A0A8H4Q0M6_9HYPO|nr:MEAB protein [Ophiocordyceps camponoti-floridani]
MSIDSKPNPPRRDDSEDSVDSTPERDHNPPPSATENASQDAQQPKRKGGRKPIYATSEERKQRNRQAQAAFRERRTEYIKQLEETIRVHESNLHNLQTAHRTAAEECLMLRYKNSLLERILLEKGIDVQAELHAKTGSPSLGSTHMPQNLVQPPPIQRAMMNRHHQSRKSISSIAPETEPGTASPLKCAASPKSRPTPRHTNSPTHVASAFSPAPSDTMSLHGSMAGLARQAMPTPAPANPAARPPLMQPRCPSIGNGASFYPTPAFQNHLDQLDHEYDGSCDLVEEPDMDTPNGHGQYAPSFAPDSQQTMLLSPTSTVPGHHISTQHEPTPQHAPTSSHPFPSMTQLLDQNLDWDPFGLSASMAFPSHQHFQFDQANLR